MCTAVATYSYEAINSVPLLIIYQDINFQCSDEDIPITVRYQKNHPIYEKIYLGDGHDNDTSKINFNNFENNYHYHSMWSDRFRELNKDWYKAKED